MPSTPPSAPPTPPISSSASLSLKPQPLPPPLVFPSPTILASSVSASQQHNNNHHHLNSIEKYNRTNNTPTSTRNYNKIDNNSAIFNKTTNHQIPTESLLPPVFNGNAGIISMVTNNHHNLPTNTTIIKASPFSFNVPTSLEILNYSHKPNPNHQISALIPVTTASNLLNHPKTESLNQIEETTMLAHNSSPASAAFPVSSVMAKSSTSNGSSAFSVYNSSSVPPSVTTATTTTTSVNDQSLPSNQNPNRPRKKQSTRDPLSHRMIEKRRRDRMNSCLNDLSRLIPHSFIKKQSSSLQNRGRIEKTEIIEMAIKYLKHMKEVCRPLLTEDGLSGPSSSVAKIETDQLFGYCLAQSTTVAAELLRDRFEHYRLGFQDSLIDCRKILSETGLESLYGKIVEHMQGHFDSLNIAIISKCMMNPSTSTHRNCDDIEIRVKTSMNADETKQRLNINTLMDLSKDGSKLSPRHKPGDNFDIKTEPMMPNGSYLPVSLGSSLNHGINNGHANKSQYSLDAIRYLMDSSASNNSSKNPLMELRNNSKKNSITNHNDIIVAGASSSPENDNLDLSNHHNYQNLLSSNANNNRPKTETEKVIVKNEFDDSITIVKQVPTITNNGNGNSNIKKQVTNTPTESYNFKKEIKDRFQKIMDRASDVSSVSSFNSESVDLTSSSNSTELPSMTNTQQHQQQNSNKTNLQSRNELPTITSSTTTTNVASIVSSSSLHSSPSPTTLVIDENNLPKKSNYMPVFALHPSGQYYVPMQIEASILGFDDIFDSKQTSLVSLPKSSSTIEAAAMKSSSTTVTTNGNGNEEPNSVLPPMIYTKDHFKRSLEDYQMTNSENGQYAMVNGSDCSNGSSNSNKKLKNLNASEPKLNNNLNFDDESAFDRVESMKHCNEIDAKPLLYPISITVNITFNRTITWASLSESLKNHQKNVCTNNHYPSNGFSRVNNTKVVKHNNYMESNDNRKSSAYKNHNDHSPSLAIDSDAIHSRNGEIDSKQVISSKSIESQMKTNNGEDQQPDIGTFPSPAAATAQLILMLASKATEQHSDHQMDKFQKHRSTMMEKYNNHETSTFHPSVERKNDKVSVPVNSNDTNNNMSHVSNFYNFNFPGNHSSFLVNNGTKYLQSAQATSNNIDHSSFQRPSSSEQQISSTSLTFPTSAYLSAVNSHPHHGHHDITSQQFSYYSALWSQQQQNNQFIGSSGTETLNQKSIHTPTSSVNHSFPKLDSIDLINNAAHQSQTKISANYDHLFNHHGHTSLNEYLYAKKPSTLSPSASSIPLAPLATSRTITPSTSSSTSPSIRLRDEVVGSNNITTNGQSVSSVANQDPGSVPINLTTTKQAASKLLT